MPDTLRIVAASVKDIKTSACKNHGFLPKTICKKIAKLINQWPVETSAAAQDSDPGVAIDNLIRKWFEYIFH